MGIPYIFEPPTELLKVRQERPRDIYRFSKRLNHFQKIILQYWSPAARQHQQGNSADQKKRYTKTSHLKPIALIYLSYS
jgi:hypothetical protein